MSEYLPPLADIRFALEHVADLPGLIELDAFADIDLPTAYGALEEYGRFMTEVIAPTNRIGDIEESRWEDGNVETPKAFRDAYGRYVEAGWGSVPFEPGFGGGGFPWVLGVAMQEMLNSANMAFAMAPLLTHGAIDAIAHHGSEEQQQVYLPKMISGAWTGTMNLTEPDAGSDVGNVRTKAVPTGDGTYRITGTKIFITFGEHDLTDNIIHLVLARLPDAPPGTKGISCFVVPKFLVQEDGSLGERNDVTCLSIEHKMGIKASPTCVLSFGETGDGAIGWLLGEPNAGMRTMFTMMNNARLGVGLEGLGVAERAYQHALAYAKERQQGRAVGAAPGTRSFIIEHPDVRRMLLTMKASIEAHRALCYLDGANIDRARNHPDEAVRAEAAEIVELLTPLCKGWGTDLGVELSSIAVQIHGGMGFIEETGVAQYYRDTKITQIYEGTNGIQAIDLVGRKLPLRAGGVVSDQFKRMHATAAELRAHTDVLGPLADRIDEATGVAEEATAWLLEHGLADVNDALAGASPYLRLLSYAVGGWLLGVEALAAQRLLDAGASDADRARLTTKVATAQFFADNLLPQVKGLLDPVRAGAAELFALSIEDF